MKDKISDNGAIHILNATESSRYINYRYLF